MYALLDSQSDTTFILKDAAVTLGAKKEPVKLKVSTITSKTKVVNSQKVQGLQVRGISSDTKIKLPTTYTRDYIPANRSHILTSITAKSWPHLEHLADEMSPELDCFYCLYFPEMSSRAMKTSLMHKSLCWVGALSATAALKLIMVMRMKSV